jgi:preprotein translocase subunit SecG
MDIMIREETLLNVMRSVTRNGRSIVLTGVLAIICVYIFSLVGFVFFQSDFAIEAEPVEMIANCTGGGAKCYEVSEAVKENSCENLIMCIITTLNQGLRSGGGIGDVLRPPSVKDRYFMGRVMYDLLFFFLVIIIILNLIFGVIIDTFADLRSEKQNKEDILKNKCFICGLERAAFNNRTVTFDDHINSEHNMWHYLYFIILIKVKDPTEFTGPESYVSELMEKRQLDWFPHLRCMSLTFGETENEQEEIRNLHTQLEQTNSLVQTLSKQLNGLREQMIEQRNNKQKLGMLANPGARNPMMHSAVRPR